MTVEREMEPTMVAARSELAYRLAKRALELAEPYKPGFYGRGWDVLFPGTHLIDTRKERIRALVVLAGRDNAALWHARGLVDEVPGAAPNRVPTARDLLKDAYFAAQQRRMPPGGS